MDSIEIIDYRPEHQPYFESLNRAWIEMYFEMEEGDTGALTRPEEMIIDKGGAILMAEWNGIIAGTVALKKINDNTFEFTKMAVHEDFRRRGIAEKLSYASFRKANQLGAKTIILYSSSILKPAITMYEKLGFRHVPVGDPGYKRSDVKMMIGISEATSAVKNSYKMI